MEKLTLDQVQMLLILFQTQNAERDIEEFVEGFHSFKYGFSKYKKIKDLFLFNSWLQASDDDGDDWSIIGYEQLYETFVCSIPGLFSSDVRFDIMKYISLEDKV